MSRGRTTSRCNELAERDATGEKAAIYAEMRRLGAVPMVALIFRHLATLDGALEWTWAAIGPAWKGGRLQEEAWRIARSAPLAPLGVTLLRQRFDDGSIARGVAAIHAAMTTAADDIVHALSAPPAPHPGIRTVCERFGGTVIPQMIVVGALLKKAIPGSDGV